MCYLVHTVKYRVGTLAPPPSQSTLGTRVSFSHFKDPPAKAAPIRNEKGVISQSFWYL
jgi:hypothetical protein